MTRAISKVRKLVLAGLVGCAGLIPAAASARDFDYRRDRGDRYDHRDDYRDRRDDRRYDRDRSRVDVRVDVGRSDICFPPAPVYAERTERFWVEPVYRTVCDRVWVEPVYRTECERVWIEPVYERREIVRYSRGRRIVDCETVLVSPGHWEERPRQVLVADGYFRNVERQEIVAPGHWEYRTVHAERRPGFSFNLEFGR